jgi:hypothetical protein
MSDRKDSGSANSSPIIVSIGTSAGGVQALQALFDALPDGTGASFVVIVHLDPQANSGLARILASRTRMPVLQVQTREEVKPNHVYVIPPGRLLQITKHGFRRWNSTGHVVNVPRSIRSFVPSRNGPAADSLSFSPVLDLMEQSMCVPSRRGVASCLSRIPTKSSIKIDGVVITFSDVTDRHRMEEALRECERKLAHVSN